MSDKAAETILQQAVLADMEASGWLVGKSANYDRERALYPEDLLAYIRETQPDEVARQEKFHPGRVDEMLLKRTSEQMDKRGSLVVLRHGF